MSNVEVREKIKDAINADARTGRELAADSGVSEGTLYSILAGRRRKLHRRTRVRLAETLGLDPVTLEPVEVASR